MTVARRPPPPGRPFASRRPFGSRRDLLARLLRVAAAVALAASVSGCGLPGQPWWRGFRDPFAAIKHQGLKPQDPDRPFRRGAVPVVLVHGILSDSSYWGGTADELRRDPLLRGRVQFWTFGYPTGTSYLVTAADLRRELDGRLRTLDPGGTDPDLNEVVLVGHSMGGLLAKLQITDSGDRMWRSVADGPFEALRADPKTKARVRDMLFFEANRRVSRVVYVGTPHRGSQLAETRLGRVGRWFVSFPETVSRRYRSLAAANKDLLRMGLPDAIPTSVDHLAPTSRALKLCDELPVRPGVFEHTIYGTGRTLADGRPGDGVVAVESARRSGAVSEVRIVEGVHQGLYEYADAVAELRRILHAHLDGRSGAAEVRWPETAMSAEIGCAAPPPFGHSEPPVVDPPFDVPTYTVPAAGSR